MASEAELQAIHVLLDMVSSWDEDAPELGVEAWNLALQRLLKVGALNAVLVDEDGAEVVTIKAGPLLAGATYLLHFLFKLTAERYENLDEAMVIAMARENLDQALRD